MLIFKWNDSTAKQNIIKHGVFFEEAATVFGGSVFNYLFMNLYIKKMEIDLLGGAFLLEFQEDPSIKAMALPNGTQIALVLKQESD